MKSASALALVLVLLSTASTALAVPQSDPDSGARDYVLGRFAADNDKLLDAARFADAARQRDPSDPAVAQRAFDLAIVAGDERLAVTLANGLAATGKGDSTVALVRLADALDRRDWKAADAARAGIADVGYAAVIAPIVEGWILFGRGDTDLALAKLDPTAMTGFAKSYVAEARAHMLAAARKYAPAAAAYHELRAGTGPGISFLVVGEADALQQSGDKAGAATLLAGANDDAVVTQARARLAAGKRIGGLASDPRTGVAWVCARLATDLSRDKPVALALVFARVATFLAPDNAASWLVAGDVLARSSYDDAALAAYGKIGANEALATAARARRADVLGDAGRGAEAEAALVAATKAADADSEAWARLGDWQRKAERYADAAKSYGRAVDLAPGGKPAWILYFLRGSTLEQAGNWSLAEPDLRTALAMAPDEPTVLNYLGYAMLDRGQDVPAAKALVERASQLKPDDGFIADSLGWAQYRLGDMAAAVKTLERAAAAEPGDPTINEHLGDAYWRSGRRIEARFRWRAAIDLDPTPKARATLASKLDYGLDVAQRLAANTVAVAPKETGAWTANTPPRN
ncbi:tetratricopeptide repeat protein [Sphingosinicellaceae bacterium]|nr:tetratricopeptide repeat protein [Sphingosinicellaceae bacterium]